MTLCKHCTTEHTRPGDFCSDQCAAAEHEDELNGVLDSDRKPAEPTVTVSAEIKVPLERIATLLCSAFEGGSNYWYVIAKFVEPKAMTFRTDKTTVFKHIDYPLNEGGALIIHAKGDSGEQDEIKGANEWSLNLDTIKAGLQTFATKYPRHFADMQAENDDAETGDVFVQCCLFGEVIYG